MGSLPPQPSNVSPLESAWIGIAVFGGSAACALLWWSLYATAGAMMNGTCS